MRTHSKSLFLKLQILKLNEIYELEMAKLMHKIYNKSTNFSRINAQKFTILDEIHPYNTRRMQQNNFYIPRVQTIQAQKSLLFSGPKIWNLIPKHRL